MTGSLGALGFGPFFAAQIVPQAVMIFRENTALSKPAAALVRLVSDIGRKLLQKG